MQRIARFSPEEATDEPRRRRYQRMYEAWLALIETEAWVTVRMIASYCFPFHFFQP